MFYSNNSSSSGGSNYSNVFSKIICLNSDQEIVIVEAAPYSFILPDPTPHYTP
jgi:hypothetical protein